MTNEQKQVKDWMTAFGQETPEKPKIPSLEVRKLRAKLILEECLETIRGLGLQSIMVDDMDGQKYPIDIGLQSISFEETPQTLNLKEIADGCEDLKVVTEGTLVACGLIEDVTGPGCSDPLFDEVMRSNWTKLWTAKEIGRYTGEGEEFDPSGIIATDIYEAENGIRIYCMNHKSDRPFLVKDKDGKVIKSPSYSPANLQPIIDELSK